MQVRDELERLIDDDDDMANLYLSRKLVDASSSPISESSATNWFVASPTTKSKVSKTSRSSVASFLRDENDVEELEMLLEVITLFPFKK